MLGEVAEGQGSRVVISGATSGWYLVMAGVPQGSVLEPALFNVYQCSAVCTISACLLVIPNWEVLVNLLRDERPCIGIWIG